jgi:hypothetical protein
MGSSSQATGEDSVCFGRGSKATANRAFAAGRDCQATSPGSFAMGHAAITGGQTSVSIGTSTTASGAYSMAVGRATTSSGKGSAAFGYRVTASSFAETVVGSCNVQTSPVSRTTVNTADVAFAVGAGTIDTSNDDACLVRATVFRVLKSGAATLSGALAQNSDARLKRDVQPLEPVMGKIEQMRPVTYHWNSSLADPRLQIGLIAQEVQELFPELVTKTDDHLGVAYGGIGVIALQGVKETAAEVKTLQAEVGRLTAQVASLEAQMAALVALVTQTHGLNAN